MKKLIVLAMAILVVFGFVSCSGNDLDMVDIPGKDFKMLKTEVTQKLYESIMGENPSYFQIGSKEYAVTEGEDVKKLPVESVSWYDAIYFCNKLSIKKGLTPVYAVDGETDVAKWNYTPHKGEKLKDEITQNVSANGFRLPTLEEWLYAARGGENYEYSGSNNLDEVGWYCENSNMKTHEIARKKPNGYGLYDMSGNVFEWCWDSHYYDSDHYYCGGSWAFDDRCCELDDRNYYVFFQNGNIGFRIVCSAVKAQSLDKPQSLDMVKIPGTNFKMLKTEVTQKLYKSVMGKNPSCFQKGSKIFKKEKNKSYAVTEGENVKKLPVEMVSWYDAIYFCNKLSVKKGLTPVYAVDGETDVAKWDYTPHKGEKLKDEITQNVSANGFRLPTLEEWLYAARGGENYEYSGSNNLDEVGWYWENSNWKTHEVAIKKPNGYGLYDMSGNVWEWCWDVYPRNADYRYYCGGSYRSDVIYCKVSCRGSHYADSQYDHIGFRMVCNAD